MWAPRHLYRQQIRIPERVGSYLILSPTAYFVLFFISLGFEYYNCLLRPHNQLLTQTQLSPTRHFLPAEDKVIPAQSPNY